jgi:hypothetical protein
MNLGKRPVYDVRPTHYTSRGTPRAQYQLFDAVATHVLAKQRLAEFDTQALAGLARAFAKMRQPQADLFNEVAAHALLRVERLSTQELSTIAHAFASLHFAHEDMFVEFARSAVSRIHSFSPLDLSQLAWAFSSLEIMETDLFASIALATASKLYSFDVPGLVRVLTAVAEADMPAQDCQVLFSAARSFCEDKLGTMSEEQHLQLATAFSNVGVAFDALFTKSKEGILLNNGLAGAAAGTYVFTL